MRYQHLILAIATTTLVACGSSSESVDISCVTVLIPAVSVNVQDAVTARHAAFGGVLLGKRADSPTVYTDTGRFVSADSLTISVGALPGTYDVLLKIPGYTDWSANGIVVDGVDGQQCPANTVHLLARVQPISAASR